MAFFLAALRAFAMRITSFHFQMLSVVADLSKEFLLKFRDLAFFYRLAPGRSMSLSRRAVARARRRIAARIAACAAPRL
ncbi:MAG: hypothetical protein IT449_12405 [Phycisphaerales bacterium]|nr:hypothetical protein [Phycisphaerales bacterium]